MKARQYLIYSVLVLMVALGMTSCVTCERSLPGERIVESRQHRGFEQIEINGSPTIVYVQADTFGVRLEGPEKMVDNIVTKVEDRTLHVYNKGRVNMKIGFVNLNWGDRDELTIYVSSPDLVGVRLNGSGDFISRRQIDTDVMNVVLRGSGDIEFDDIICDRFTTELIGSGDIKINQLEARTSSAMVIGSGDVVINQSNVIDTNLSLRGSGDISVNFEEGCESAQCQLSGSGDIELSGTLFHYDAHKSGSGDITVDNLIIRDR